MKNKDRIILKKILDYCGQCDEALDMFEHSYEKFITDSVFQNACCMCVLQIGELCKVISDELREEVTDIPWKQWCGVRDIFAHQYSNLDHESAWDTITKDLPALKQRVQEIMPEQDKPVSYNDFFGCLPEIGDGMEFQKKARDEWNERQRGDKK